ncbi:TetR family transcriptional regulator [Nocardia sp. NBC_00565]|uniref:TetR/AcrR family transcriptional regulator n=1 Tax=Nocardia sp. NBC_00565 TaxID=2975993 RepID=UPI002E812614|nr:TetR family transcriptional regulator [Nocardia sp. NBC_00565]WUC05714.1 TetR family transcriptional regulator [Nocardia sp. NBC_00565]
MPSSKTRASLNLDEIVDNALGLIREGGVASLSMRQLSTRLGASLGATYRHLPTKEALLDLCGKALFDRCWQPLQVGEDPLEWLEQQVMNLYNVLTEYRGMAEYVVRHTRDVVNPVHEVLIESGFSESEAPLVATVLTLYTAGALLTDFEHTIAVDAPDPKAMIAAGMHFVLSGPRPVTGAKGTRGKGMPARS